MNIEQLLGPLNSLCIEDQGDNDFIKDEGTDGLAIYVSGHYSIKELEMKLRELKEAERIANELTMALMPSRWSTCEGDPMLKPGEFYDAR